MLLLRQSVDSTARQPWRFRSQTASGSEPTPLLSQPSMLRAIPGRERWRSKQWAQVPLPVEPGVILLDLEFVPDEPNHGFILGTRQTVLETLDGGKTWEQRFLGNAVRPHARTHGVPKAHSLRDLHTVSTASARIFLSPDVNAGGWREASTLWSLPKGGHSSCESSNRERSTDDTCSTTPVCVHGVEPICRTRA